MWMPLENHGALAVGGDVVTAFYRMESLALSQDHHQRGHSGVVPVTSAGKTSMADRSARLLPGRSMKYVNANKIPTC